MSDLEPVAHLIELGELDTIDVMGPTIQFLTRPQADDGSPCLLRGTIPPGGVVPLHRHADPETFIAISGEVEGLTERDGRYAWVRVRPGDVFHVPGGAKHAWRNGSSEPAMQFIVTTSKLGRFFQEIGLPIGTGERHPVPPAPMMLKRLKEVSDRYGYWSGSPEENARVGLMLPPIT